MKVQEIIIVSDGRLGCIMPYSRDDLAAIKKHRKAIDAAFTGKFLVNGFWKITIKSYFFGIYKELVLEKLQMEL